MKCATSCLTVSRLCFRGSPRWRAGIPQKKPKQNLQGNGEREEKSLFWPKCIKLLSLIIFFQCTGASCKIGRKINSAQFFLNALRVNKPIYEPVVYFWIGKMLIAPPPPPPPPPGEPTVEWNISCHRHHHQPTRCLRGLLEITGRNIKNWAAATKHRKQRWKKFDLSHVWSWSEGRKKKKLHRHCGTSRSGWTKKLTFSFCRISETLFLMETEPVRRLCKYVFLSTSTFVSVRKRFPAATQPHHQHISLSLVSVGPAEDERRKFNTKRARKNRVTGWFSSRCLSRAAETLPLRKVFCVFEVMSGREGEPWVHTEFGCSFFFFFRLNVFVFSTKPTPSHFHSGVLYRRRGGNSSAESLYSQFIFSLYSV